MSTPTGLGDLTEYVATIWGGRKIIFAVTAGSALVMALLTMALPKLYIVRSVVDAGVLPDVQPRELNLFVDAVARNEFVVEGGRFGNSLTDSLMATFRPPSTIVLEVRSVDPAGATERLTVLTAGVLAELERAFESVRDTRPPAERRIDGLLAQVAVEVKRLITVSETRRDSAVRIAILARDAEARAAGQRDALRAAAASRYAAHARSAETGGAPGPAAAAQEIGKWLRAGDPAPNPAEVLEAEHRRRSWVATLGSSSPVFAGLAAVSAELAAADLRVLNALRIREAADALQQREERALQVLAGSPAPDAAAALRMKAAFDELPASFEHTSDVAALAQRTMSDALAKIAEADAVEQAALRLDVPHIVTPPSVPERPTWPRPIVNIAIAILFGLIGSTLVVSIKGRSLGTQEDHA